MPYQVRWIEPRKFLVRIKLGVKAHTCDPALGRQRQQKQNVCFCVLSAEVSLEMETDAQ